mmetsp:Transcript_27614/g.56586  ORF Transcript_27614/g.56586 Transcript_27614/m.56586 type:complete len:221 (+) Transcript_27614:172-834(+)
MSLMISPAESSSSSSSSSASATATATIRRSPRPIVPPRRSLPLRMVPPEPHGPQPDPNGRIFRFQPRTARPVPRRQHRLRHRRPQSSRFRPHRFRSGRRTQSQVPVRRHGPTGWRRLRPYRHVSNLRPIVLRSIRLRRVHVRFGPRGVQSVGRSVRYGRSQRGVERPNGDDGGRDHSGTGLRGDGGTGEGVAVPLLRQRCPFGVQRPFGPAIRSGSDSGG